MRNQVFLTGSKLQPSVRVNPDILTKRNISKIPTYNLMLFIFTDFSLDAPNPDFAYFNYM